MNHDQQFLLSQLALYFEAGGSRWANLHESPYSWAANELRQIRDGATILPYQHSDEDLR